MAGEVAEGFAGLACVHPLGAGVVGAQEHGEAAGVIRVAGPEPADAGRVVEVVVLLAIGVLSPGLEEVVDQLAVGDELVPPRGIVAGVAEVVAVEDAG